MRPLTDRTLRFTIILDILLRMKTFRSLRHPNTPDSAYEHLFDGDEHIVYPGVDFGTINSFRVRLSRMCRARDLRYATLVLPADEQHPIRLYVVIYRKKVGDLYEETYPGDTFNSEDGPLAPEPEQ